MEVRESKQKKNKEANVEADGESARIWAEATRLCEEIDAKNFEMQAGRRKRIASEVRV